MSIKLKGQKMVLTHDINVETYGVVLEGNNFKHDQLP